MSCASETPAFDYPVLIGDIGGTNARFAILAGAGSEPHHFPSVRTVDFATIDEAIRTAILDRTPTRPRSAVLAVAAPIDGDVIPLTNCEWVVRPRDMVAKLGLADIVLLNDFEAQALAVVALGTEHLLRLGGGEPEPTASRVVLGPGTGLGVAGLVQAAGIWVPVPGEGGHVDLGPRTARDRAVFPHLEPIEGRISAEQMLCGRGLVNIYRAISAADGQAPQLSDPAAITAAAHDRSDAAAVEAVDLFATCLGRLAGDLALIFMSRGGVYLTGGITPRILPALESGLFRAAFDDKAPHGALLKAMPVFVITHPLAALEGLAAFARDPALFGIETRTRRWRAA